MRMSIHMSIYTGLCDYFLQHAIDSGGVGEVLGMMFTGCMQTPNPDHPASRLEVGASGKMAIRERA